MNDGATRLQDPVVADLAYQLRFLCDLTTAMGVDTLKVSAVRELLDRADGVCLLDDYRTGFLTAAGGSCLGDSRRRPQKETR